MTMVLEEQPLALPKSAKEMYRQHGGRKVPTAPRLAKGT